MKYVIVVKNNYGQVVESRSAWVFTDEAKAEGKRKQIQYLLDTNYPDLQQRAVIRITENDPIMYHVYNDSGMLMTTVAEEEAFRLMDIHDDWTMVQSKEG